MTQTPYQTPTQLLHKPIPAIYYIHVIKENNADLVFISETWLKNSVPDEVIAIDGYRVFRQDRTEKEHSGVCIYTKDSYLAM